MGTAVTPPDAGAANALSQARSAAVESLKGQLPDPGLGEQAPNSRVQLSINGQGGAPAPPAPGSAGIEPSNIQPGPDAQPMPMSHQVEPPEPPVPMPASPKTFEGSESEIGNGVMRGFAQLDRMAAVLIGMPAAKLWDVTGNNPNSTTAQDAVGHFIDHVLNHAVDYWHPEKPTGTGAQVLGDVSTMVPALATGPLAEAILPAQSATDAGVESIRQGQDAKTALTLALTAAVTTAAGMKLPLKSPNIVKRIASGVAGNIVLNTASEALTKKILKDNDYQEAASQIDLTDPKSLFESGLIGAIFGAIAGKGGPKEVRSQPRAEAAPDISLTPGVSGQEPPPPASVVPMPASPARVVDTPSSEPLTDLQAQVADMKDAKTPRQYVYVSPEDVAKLTPEGVRKLADGAPVTANFDGRQGALISRDVASRVKATQIRKTEPDMQKVLGQLTGAGEGKTTEQTAVVQGRTPEGAVATETGVTPAEVPAAAQAVAEQGKTPVVTTPEAAVARRAEAVAAENAPASSSSTGSVEQSKPTAQEPAKTDVLRTVKINGEDIPVRVVGPAKEGKVPVRLIDAEGRVSKEIRQVPEHMMSGEGAKETATLVEPTESTNRETSSSASEAPEPAPSANGLQTALDQFRAAETTPTGKKFPGKIPERASRVAEFARAVKSAVSKTEGLPDNVVEDASAVAKRAERLDMKTPEAMAKNQGIGHSQLEAHAKDLIRVAGNILQPEKAIVPEKPTEAAQRAPRLAQIKAKLERERARVSKPESAPEKPEPKVKVAPDVPDETKPRELNAGDRARIAAASQRYLRVTNAEAADAHANLERVLHESLGPGGREQADEMLRLVREHREDQQAERLPKKPRRMSDTLEEEDIRDDRGTQSEVEDESYDSPGHAYEDTGFGRDWKALHDNLGPFYKALDDQYVSGRAASLHKILDYLGTKATGSQRELFQSLRAVAPNLPVRVVHEVVGVNSEVRPKAIGHYMPGRDDIQLRRLTSENQPMTAQVLAHEAVHASTVRFMRGNPSHPLTLEMKQLYDTAMRRLKASGEESQYGHRNPEEFVAEAFTSPTFRNWLQKSEGLWHRFAQTVAKMLGFRGPSGLLEKTIETGSQIMDAQAAARQDAIERAIKEQGYDLEHEHEFRSVVGDHATDLAKSFRRVVRSGSIESIRRGTRSLTPYGGLVRAALRRGVFGADNEANPLRRFDEAQQQRNVVLNKTLHGADKIVRDWSRFSLADNIKFSRFLRDSTIYSIDPRQILDSNRQLRSDAELRAELPARVTEDAKFSQRLAEFRDRWNNLSHEQRRLYGEVIDHNERMIRANRKAAVDTALDSYSDKEVPSAKRSLLYAARGPQEFESLIGHGREIDVGDRNDKLISTLQELGATHELEGPYAHLGRYGEHVVQVQPEGMRVFDSAHKAESYAQLIRDLGGRSKAKVAEVGGKWQVDYKADYVSMHENGAQADAEIERLRAAGYDVGSATTKLLSDHTAGMTGGLQNLIAEVGRKLERPAGKTDETEAMKEALAQSFVKILAARSSYAGSKLARYGSGGVKPEEMLRAFAAHAQAMAWNTSQLASVFKVGQALGDLRTAVKDSSQEQRVATNRGGVYDELSRRMKQENEQAGSHNPWNARIAKVGFFNYLFSLSHSIVYLTQNFTTGIPVAGARFGMGKAASSFGASMKLISSPAFRESMRALALKQDADGILNAIVQTVAKDVRFGKYAQGDNSALQQLIDRGAVHTSFSNQLAEHAQGNGGTAWNRAIDWARIVPAFADLYNRISTGLAALELHNGDVYKAGDFVRETHMDYSNADRSRAFRVLNKVPGGNTLTMFKTYTTGMAHLLYSHVIDGITGQGHSRTEAFKTVAGMMLGAALFGGLQRGVGIEPLRLAMYAYHKLVGDNDEYHDFDNMTRRWVADVVGQGKAADVLNHGLPALVGADMSTRLGLSDLFLHNPPDMLAMDKSDWMKFGGTMLGPGFEEIVNSITGMTNAFQSGRVGDIAKLLPIKLLHNVNDALEAGTTGLKFGSGAQKTQPSLYDAAIKAIGFRTSAEANAAEKSSTAYDYRKFASNKQYDLIQQWTKAPTADRSAIWRDKIIPFNKNNPGHRITLSKLLQQQRIVHRQGQEAQGVSRDPAERALINY